MGFSEGPGRRSETTSPGLNLVFTNSSSANSASPKYLELRAVVMNDLSETAWIKSHLKSQNILRRGVFFGVPVYESRRRDYLRSYLEAQVVVINDLSGNRWIKSTKVTKYILTGGRGLIRSRFYTVIRRRRDDLPKYLSPKAQGSGRSRSTTCLREPLD
ncbi:unnamed protein product [Trichogramma brassicae]|uniref:Uncharacterized protein n=1 Tax=Trichogramma brassicae TaxID=86971 RepID=A0A6H5HWB8_9HYME|nr:unnamed protein product [Trichogramma brassicae]